MFFKSRHSAPPAMTLEGVLGPNSRLDDAESLKIDAPNAMCVAESGHLLLTSGKDVLALGKWGDKPKVWASFDAPVTAVCAGPEGQIAVGLAGGSIVVRDKAGKEDAGWPVLDGLKSVADCAFAPDGGIVAVDNGYGADEDIMSVASWDATSRGRIVAFSRDGMSKELGGTLHCPMGVASDPADGWIVSLFERGSLVDPSGKVRRSGYPAYPGRIHRTDNGYVMACLARRDPLIEFLKTEKEFVAEMKATMEPRHWISPRATPERRHDFPIEAGATRLFGEIKPWAPSFSYGLVIELDDNFIPVASAHSRANGLRHEITDAIIWNGDLVAVSRASGELLKAGRGSTST